MMHANVGPRFGRSVSVRKLAPPHGGSYKAPALGGLFILSILCLHTRSPVQTISSGII